MPTPAQVNYQRSTIVVPISVWKRLRSITYFFHRLEADMIKIEEANNVQSNRSGLRNAVVRDLALCDGNLAENMDPYTLDQMYGEMADNLLARYKMTPIKEKQ